MSLKRHRPQVSVCCAHITSPAFLREAGPHPARGTRCRHPRARALSLHTGLLPPRCLLLPTRTRSPIRAPLFTAAVSRPLPPSAGYQPAAHPRRCPSDTRPFRGSFVDGCVARTSRIRGPWHTPMAIQSSRARSLPRSSPGRHCPWRHTFRRPGLHPCRGGGRPGGLPREPQYSQQGKRCAAGWPSALYCPPLCARITTADRSLPAARSLPAVWGCAVVRPLKKREPCLYDHMRRASSTRRASCRTGPARSTPINPGTPADFSSRALAGLP